MRPWWILLLCASTASAAVFDIDDRIAEQGTPADLMAIGVVRDGNSHRATAFLVGDCEVLTARHASGKRSTAIGQRLMFARPGAEDGGSSGTVVAEGEFDPRHHRHPADYQGDWMLLRLERCLGRGGVAVQLNPVSISWPRSSPTMQSAGFPGQRRWRKGITRDPACRVRMVINGICQNDCAALPGDSGSPLFTLEGEGDQRRMIVYAMQVAADHWPGVQPWQVSRANLAIDASVIAPLIAPFLTRSKQQAGTERRRTDDPDRDSNGLRPGAQVRTR